MFEGLIFTLGLGLTVWAMVQAQPFWVYTLLALLFSVLWQTQFGIGFGWLLFNALLLGCSALILLPQLRQRWTQPLFDWVKKQVPPLSQTEYEALISGDVGKEANLLAGSPRFEDWLILPKPTLSAAEQAFIDGPVETLCRLIDDWEDTHHRLDLSPACWQYIKEQQFFAFIIPKEQGGLDFSAHAQSLIIQKIATKSVAAAVTVMVPNSLGPAELLIKYGTQAQREQYLPRLAKGEEIPCFALTGIEVGSDASSMPDKGIVAYGDYQGETVLGLRLSWSKRYITLAPVATVMGLAVKVYDPDQLLSDTPAVGISLCLIPTDYPGVKIGKRHFPLNQAFLNGPTEGQDVFVPMSFVIGGQDGLGQGWRMLMACLAQGRGLSLPAVSTGLSKLCFQGTGAYARIRAQFKVPIGQFEGVASHLAEITLGTFLQDCLCLGTTHFIDQGVHSAVVAGITKYHATEWGRRVINAAMDVQAGKAIMMGPHNHLARAYESIPISITVEGANTLTRSLLIFGQGVLRCHPYLFKEIEAKTLSEFEPAFFGHLRSLWSVKLRWLWFYLTAKRGLWIRSKALRPYQKTLSYLTFISLSLRLSTEFALLALGGHLKRREHLSARLGDVLSHLYLAACVVYHQGQMEANTERDTLVQASLAYCADKATSALWDFWGNCPLPWLGRVVRRCWFPLGKPEYSGGDQQIQALAALSLQEGSMRARWKKAVAQTAPGLMDIEAAFALHEQAEACFKVIETALKTQGKWPYYQLDRVAQLQYAKAESILSEADYALCKTYEQHRQRSIAVDSFDKDSLCP